MADLERLNIQVYFTKNNYTDALYYSLQDYLDGKINRAKIEADKLERYNRWIERTTPVEEPIP